MLSKNWCHTLSVVTASDLFLIVVTVKHLLPCVLFRLPSGPQVFPCATLGAFTRLGRKRSVSTIALPWWSEENAESCCTSPQTELEMVARMPGNSWPKRRRWGFVFPWLSLQLSCFPLGSWGKVERLSLPSCSRAADETNRRGNKEGMLVVLFYSSGSSWYTSKVWDTDGRSSYNRFYPTSFTQKRSKASRAHLSCCPVFRFFCAYFVNPIPRKTYLVLVRSAYHWGPFFT